MRTRFKAWLDHTTHSVLPRDSLGEALHYALKHRSALKTFNEAGHLHTSNNHAELCIRAVAGGREAFLFVGSERAGDAAAICYSPVESCKANNVNPLNYLTDILGNARNRAVPLPTPDEFTHLGTAAAGRCSR